MARAQPAEIASTNSDAARGDAVRGALTRYLKDLEGQPLAVRTREAYGAHVTSYATWLDDRPDAEVALREPRARDHAARDFKRHLKLERQSTQAHCLHLVANAVIHWNTIYTQLVLDELPHSPTDDQLAGLTPAIFEHVNALGTYTFNTDRPGGQLRPLRAA